MSAPLDNRQALVDTNVVVYAYDLDEPVKHDQARLLLEPLSNEGRLVFSAQVFNEFVAAMIGPKRKRRLFPAEVETILLELQATGRVLPITASLTFRALRAMPRHGLSFWDALIWAAAAENQIGTIYTEDFQHGRDIEGVLFVNPFRSPWPG